MAEFVDIAPALLEKLQTAFAAKLEQSGRIATLREAMQKGNSYVPVENYAAEVGELLAETLREHLSSAVLPDGRLYYNIADKVLRPLLEADRKLVSDAAVQTLNRMHEAAGIGIKAQPAPEDAKRVNDLLNLAAHTETYDDVAGTVEQAAVTYSQSVADETLKRNVDFIGRSGRRPKIIRTATSHCCEWCKNLAHTYEYPVENENVYRRHSNCRCTVEYDPGGAKRFQNVHNKEWKTAEERAKIEERKLVGIDDFKGVIQTRINKGEYSLILSEQQYLKHVEGTKQFDQYRQSRAAKGKTIQGRLTISADEAQHLIRAYTGKGMPKITKGGSVANVEYVTTSSIVGAYYDSPSGTWHETKRIAIHYGKRGTHIVPVEEEYANAD